jgi:5'(3')-deoxyribonucleotidase
MMQLPILLDCDGVLADFLTTVLREAGIDRTTKEITDWDLRESLTADEHLRVIRILSDSDDIARKMDVMPGAQAAVDEMRAAGFHIVVVTSPWDSNKTWEHQRRKWLATHFGVKSNNIVSTASKHLVDGAVLVDDKVQTVERWRSQRGRPAVLFRHPYAPPTKEPHIDVWDADSVRTVVDMAIAACRRGRHGKPR